MNLTQQWANWKVEKPPFILKLDKDVFCLERNIRRIATIGSWPEAYQGMDFAAPQDPRLHLGLLPQPFLGDVHRASVYVLSLNPGLSPGDYFAEYEVEGFRKALLANLKQKFTRGSLPFLFLDPQYAWHGGFDWWHGKLRGVISCLAKAWRVKFNEARARLARKLASIELVPYHSLDSASRWIQRLASVSLARDFVHDVIIPRVTDGKAIVIVLRRAEDWKLPRHSRVIIYTPQQARAASLSPRSPGGRAILHHFGSV